MLEDYRIHPVKPLNSSDVAESKLVANTFVRMNFINGLIELPTHEKVPLLSRVLQPIIRVVYPYLPLGSPQRLKAKQFMDKLPSFLRNQIIFSLAKISRKDSKFTSSLTYSMDLGFGLPTSDDPLITLVIPVHNNWWITYRCLRSLQGNSDKTPYEIIVVDDASTDQTHEALLNLRGIKVVQNLTNLGYLHSTNRGASLASLNSKFLVLLNNDTQPIDGWLDNLYEVIQKDDSVAIVGSALINQNGTLQEAGGQVFRDGSAWNLGRNKQITSNLFGFVREVDYCSAASVIVRKSFWEELNGFDTQFAPAYYEDTDLAMAAWDKGMKVLYAPKSWVLHFEGSSHGTTLTSGIKRNQITNSSKFFKKWELNLKNHWDSTKGARFEKSRNSKGIVVLCDRQMPSIKRDSGSIRTLQIIRHIQALEFHVVLICLDNSSTSTDIDQLQNSGVEVYTDFNDFRESLKMRESRVVSVWTIRVEVFEFFKKHLKETFPSAVFIADLLDIEYREQYIPNSGVSKRQINVAQEVDKIIFVSETETLEFNDEANVKKATTLWKEFEPQEIKKDWAKTSGLIFVGGFRHLPNLEGIEWFADEVLPELIKIGFNAPVRVIGSGLESSKVLELEEKGLQIFGMVEDIASVYLQSRVVISPLLNGAGRKGKIGEALTFGLPIVSTSVGVQGFTQLQDTGIYVADSPHEMAKIIYELHENYELWNRAETLGKNYCLKHLSSAAMRAAISGLINSSASK